MASNDVPKLWRQTVNPALGLDSSRLTSLLYQVVGVSGVDSIELPSDPPLTHFRRTRQLLLRLQWIFEALQANYVTASMPSTPLDGSTSLRILLLLVKMCSSNELNAGSKADYNLWRHVAIHTLISAARTFLLADHDTTLEEEDLVLAAFQSLCDAWEERQELSALERVVFDDILPHSISAQSGSSIRTITLDLEKEIENLVAGVAGTPSEAKEHFWALHDKISEGAWCISGFPSVHSRSAFDLSSAHGIIELACERSRDKDVYRSCAAIIQFQAERLASVLRVFQTPRQWHEDANLLDRQLAMRASRIITSEKEDFGRSFLTSHAPRIEHSPVLSPITPSEIKFMENDSQNDTETTVGSDSLNIEFEDTKDSITALGLIPTSCPSLPPKSTTGLSLMAPSIEDSASLYLPEPVTLSTTTSEIFDHEIDLRPRSGTSSTDNSSSRKKGRMNKLLRSVSKVSMQPLPSNLECCFTGPGNRIIIWSRDVAEHVVLINPQTYSGQRFTLNMPALPTHKRFNKRIRHLTSTGNVIVAIVHIENSRWLYHSAGNLLQPMHLLEEDMPSVSILSLSPDGQKVALGCGKSIYVYTRYNDELRGPRKLPLLNSTDTQAVRAHRLKFSIDSKKLISCLQVKNKSPQNALYVSIWSCNGSGFELDSQLSPILLSQGVLGYSDETGISSVYLAGESEPRTPKHVFLTAALSKPYPSIIPLTPNAKYNALDLQNKRIDSSAQCLAPYSSHFIAVKSGYHEIYRVDVRNSASELVANFTKERKYIQNHPIALSMGGADIVYSVWRTRDESYVLKTSVLVDGLWTTSSMDVGPMYRQLAETL